MSMPFPPTPPISRSRSSDSQAGSDSPQTSRRLEVESIPHVPSFENLNYHARSHSLESDDDDHSSHETDSPLNVADKRQQFSDRKNSSKSSVEDRRRDYGGQLYGSENILSRTHHEEQPYRRSSEGIGGDRERAQRRQHSASLAFYGGRLEGGRERMLIGARRRDKTTGMCRKHCMAMVIMGGGRW